MLGGSNCVMASKTLAFGGKCLEYTTQIIPSAQWLRTPRRTEASGTDVPRREAAPASRRVADSDQASQEMEHKSNSGVWASWASRPSKGFDNARGVFSFSHGVAEMNAGPQARACGTLTATVLCTKWLPCDIPSAHRLERSMRHDDERLLFTLRARSEWKPKMTMRGSGRVRRW